MTDIEHAFLEDMVELRELSKHDKAAILEHQETCKECLQHLHNPHKFERCFAYSWWIRKAKFGEKAGADRRFPETIQVIRVKDDWHDGYVVVLTCVSSLQIWEYHSEFEHMVYHCCSDIE